MNSEGCLELVVWATILATGVRLRAFTAFALASTSADAPSEIELEFAAVTVPSALKAGLRDGIFSRLALPGCSSMVTVV